MGNAATRSLERVAAAMGALESAPVEFQATCDVTWGGVLLALPALLAAGLLRYTPEMYQLPNGFYGIDSIFLLLALAADARTLLRQIFDTEADLTLDPATNTLTVRLHHLTQAAHDQAIEQLLVELNATQTIFPGTHLALVFKLGSP
jgi:hypothetical protein